VEPMIQDISTFLRTAAGLAPSIASINFNMETGQAEHWLRAKT
jgi:hypothetical protein